MATWLRTGLFPIVVLALVGAARSAEAQSPATAQPSTLAEFRRMGWLVGEWRGSGGAYPSFFEDYRFLDDSTMLQRNFADSTFEVVTDSSWIEWRGGSVSKRSARSRTVGVIIAADSVQFRREGATSGGFTWTRNSAEQWTARLHAGRPGGPEVVYVLRRTRRP